MFKKIILRFVLTTFFFTSIGPLPDASAQTIIDLPAPGIMVNKSNAYEPLQLIGIQVNIKNPLRFDFLIDKGDSHLYGQPLKDEIIRLTKYFLTCLTVPEDDLWVNLSPYEKDRIVPGSFGITLMGKDLLEQDYLLKQIMASLSYPENELGKRFWQRVYRRAYELYGTTAIPINTFNKVWILPKSAEVYARGNGAFVVKSRLDVMLEADYRAFTRNLGNKNLGMERQGVSQYAGAYSQVLRDVILPELRQEVNEGSHFAVVRQVYNSMILATWYKRHLKDSLLGRMYVGKNKVAGVDIADRNAKDEIFHQYLRAYKKCVYNYIKEDYDPFTQQIVPRKYASGGMYFAGFGDPGSVYEEQSTANGMAPGTDLAMATVDLSATGNDGKIVTFPDPRTVITDRHPFYQVPLEVHGAFSDDQAMVASKFIRRLILPMVLAVAGFMMTPQMASAASSNSPPMATEEQPTSLSGDMYKSSNDDWKKGDHDDFFGTVFHKGLAIVKLPIVVGLVPIDMITQKPPLASVKQSTILSGQVYKSSNDDWKRGDKGDLLGTVVNKSIAIGKLPLVVALVPFDMIGKGIANLGRPSFTTRAPIIVSYANIPKETVPVPVVDRPNPTPLAATAPSTVTLPNAIQVTLPPPVVVAQPNTTPPVATVPTIVTPPNAIQVTLPPPVVVVQPNTPPPAAPAPATTAPAPATVMPANAVVPQEQAVPIPTSSATQPVPVVEKLNIPTTAPSTDGGVSSGGNPPPPPPENTGLEILQNLKSMWPWYAGLAVLGVGIGIGGILLSRRQSKKETLNTNNPTKKVQTPAVTGLVIENSSRPLASTPEELASLPELRAKLDALSAGNTASSSGRTSISSNKIGPRTWVIGPGEDLLALISGIALAVHVFGLDPVSLTVVGGGLLLTNAINSTSNLWEHEMWHMAAAFVLYPLPKYWKKSLRPSNWRGNISFKNWFDFFLSRLKLATFQGESPGILFPGKGWRDWAIGKSGIAGTILRNVLACGAVYWFAVDHMWLMPFLGVMGVNALSAIKAAWISDRNGSLEHPSGERWYPCGISVHSQLGKRKVLAAQGDEVSLGRMERMIRTEGDRGLHEAGVLNMRDNKERKVITTLKKTVEGKRGPGSDSVGSIIRQMRYALAPIVADRTNQDEYVMDTTLGHNRLASQDLVTKPAAHPHVGPTHKKILWDSDLNEGKALPPEMDVEIARPDEEDKDNVAAGIVHNGDKDAYRPLATDRFIDNLDELRAFAIKLVRFVGVLPPGDTPVIPLLIHYHLTQGNADASVNFSHNTVHHKTITELEADILTEDEEMVSGRIFNRGIRRFKPVLCRPGLKDPEKSLNDMYVSKKMADAHPDDEVMQFQYQALEELRKYLINEFKKEAAAGNLSEKITKHWQGPDRDQVIQEFVELAVYKFFTGNRETAIKEFKERAQGTFGLAVKESTDLNGKTLVSSKLGMFFGYNLEKGDLDAASDPYALLEKYPNGDQLTTLFYLDPLGKGEMANFQFSKVTGKLHLRIFSFELNRYLREDEIHARAYPCIKGNRYYKPLYQYKDERRRIIEDMDLVTPAISSLVNSFDDENASKPVDERDFNYQSGMKIFKSLMVFWIQGMMDEKLNKGGQYHAIYGRVNKIVRTLAQECLTSNRCSEDQKVFLNTEASATPENSVLMAFIHRSISQDALAVATGRINKTISQQYLNELIPQIIQMRADKIIGLLTIDDLPKIYQYWVEERKHPFSGKRKIGMLFAGDEDSDDGPKTSEDSWDALLPNISKEFVSAYKILDYNKLNFDITSPAVTVLTSKAGGNFNTMQALDIMINAVGMDHVWGVTGSPASPLSVALGQRLRPESPFTGHVFYTGDHYRAQTKGLSGSLTSALQNILPIFVALQFAEYCPGEHPFGLDLNPEKIAYYKQIMRKMMIKDAKHITGRDEEGYKVVTPVNQALVKRAKYLAKRLWETPSVNLMNYLYVYGVFLCGGPILVLLNHFNIDAGIPLHSWTGFIRATADYIFTVAAVPLCLTLIYRKLSAYTPWVRLGPPTNVAVTGKDSYPEVQKMFWRIAFSRSFSTWGSQVMSENYQRAIAYQGPALVRGSWIFGHIPATTLLKNAKDALRQLKVTRTGIGGTRIARTGAISFTTSRGEFKDPRGVVSDNNVDIGGTEYLPPKYDKTDLSKMDPDMVRVYESFDAWGANLAFIYQTSVLVDTVTFKGKAWDPSRKVNNALSLTTQSGQILPNRMPKDIASTVSNNPPPSADRSVTDLVTADRVSLAQTNFDKGGISMNSRLMQLKITGDSHNRVSLDNTMLVNSIKGVVPRVSGIVPVTPEMLKDMLGEGYLN